MQVGVYRVEAERKPVDELFVLFRRIVNMYIVAGSELEINIATAMRKKVLEVRDAGGQFLAFMCLTMAVAEEFGIRISLG